MTSTLTKHQEISFGPRIFTEKGEKYRITAIARHDDRCGNGHNTFAIRAIIDRSTRNGRWVEEAGGCCHDEVARHFSELAPLIKWHLVSTDGPTHYIANTLYHVSDRDHNGLRAGETKPIRTPGGKHLWKAVVRDENGDEIKTGASHHWVASEEKPTGKLTAAWEPIVTVGVGKERRLDHARRCAIWPDATDEDLLAPDLEERLRERLPALMAEFRAAVESLGFTY